MFNFYLLYVEHRNINFGHKKNLTIKKLFSNNLVVSLISIMSDSNPTSTTNASMMTVMTVTIVSRVLSMTNTFDNSLETSFVIRNVLDNTSSTISFFQGVSSFYVMTVSVLVLGLNVMSVRVVDSVLEFVMSRNLQKLVLNYHTRLC